MFWHKNCVLYPVLRTTLAEAVSEEFNYIKTVSLTLNLSFDKENSQEQHTVSFCCLMIGYNSHREIQNYQLRSLTLLWLTLKTFCLRDKKNDL